MCISLVVLKSFERLKRPYWGFLHFHYALPWNYRRVAYPVVSYYMLRKYF